MSVGAAVSASTGNAYICVEHLEPAISSHPPNAKAAVVMLRLLETPSEPIPATGEKPQGLCNGFFSPDCPVSPLTGGSSPSLWQNRLPPPTGTLCQPINHPNLMPCAEQLCWRGHWWYLGWRRPVAPTLTLSCPNNGIWQIPLNEGLSCWSGLTQVSHWLSRASPQRLCPLVEDSMLPLSSKFLVLQKKKFPR